MRSIVFGILAMLVLSGCDKAPDPATAEFNRNAPACKPVLIAEAEDGTRLWAVGTDCPNISGTRRVYFSSSGAFTEHSETCGRNCTHSVPDGVPNARR